MDPTPYISAAFHDARTAATHVYLNVVGALVGFPIHIFPIFPPLGMLVACLLWPLAAFLIGLASILLAVLDLPERLLRLPRRVAVAIFDLLICLLSLPFKLLRLLFPPTPAPDPRSPEIFTFATDLQNVYDGVPNRSAASTQSLPQTPTQVSDHQSSRGSRMERSAVSPQQTARTPTGQQMVSISPDTLRLLESMVHTPHATYEELNLLDAGVEPEAIREQRLQRAYRVLGIVNDDQMDGARGPPTKRRRCSDPENQISDQQGPDGRSIDQQRSVSRRRPYVRTTEAREAHHSQRPRSRSSMPVSPTTPVRGNRSILEPPTSRPSNSAHETVNGSPQSNGRRDSRRESLSSTPVSPTAPTYSGFPSAGLSTSRRLSISSSAATPSPGNGYASPATTNGSSMRNSRSMVSLPLNRGQQQPERRSSAHRPSSSTTSLTSIPESQTARQLRDEESSDDNRTNGT